MTAHWTLDDIDWGAFDRSRVDLDFLRIVKASALVERNGGDYAIYLCNVFHDDSAFQASARAWAEEEVRHGMALGRWACLADPAWDFEAAFRDFAQGFRLPLEAKDSVRGSRTGELISRCVVETGTSSYYTALADASAEPVLKEIARKIAADELRHYKLFYDAMKAYAARDGLGPWGRLRAGLGRIVETQDDELAYAYYAANRGDGAAAGTYERRANARAYERRAYRVYRPAHVERGIGMVLKAVGLKANSRLRAPLARAATRYLAWRAESLAKAGA